MTFEFLPINPDPPKFKRSQFRIRMNNISGENTKPADPSSPWYIFFFGMDGVDRFVGIEPKFGLLQLRKSFDEILWFKTEGEAEKRLNQAIDFREFEHDVDE